MSIPISLIKLLFSNQKKNHLNIQLNKISECFDWSQFVTDLNLSTFGMLQLEYSNVEKEKLMWEDIAKFSIDLWRDYQYYRQFSFQSRHDTDEYREQLRNLGFMCEHGTWISVHKPDVADVQMNVFVYCLYRFVLDQMERCDEIYQNYQNNKRSTSTLDALKINDDKSEFDSVFTDKKEVISSDISASVKGLKKCMFCNYINKKDETVCSNCNLKLFGDANNLHLRTNEEWKDVYNAESFEAISSTKHDREDNLGLVNEIKEKNQKERKNTKGIGNHNLFLEPERGKIHEAEEGSCEDWICGDCQSINKLCYEKCFVCLVRTMSGSGSRDFTKEDKTKGEIVNDAAQTNIKVKHTDAKIDRNTMTSSNIWKCSRCAFNNQRGHTKCTACGTLNPEELKPHKPIIRNFSLPENKSHLEFPVETKQDTTWACLSCSFINKATTKSCETCLTFKETVTLPEYCEIDDATPPVLHDTWHCYHCSWNNTFGKYVCLKCHQYAPFFTKWVCEICGFFNGELVNNCGMCNAKNNQICSTISVKNNAGSICKPRIDLATVTPESVTPIIRTCAMCKHILNQTDDGICNKCLGYKWFCNNRWCGTINHPTTGYCCDCKLKKGCYLTDYNTVMVLVGLQFVKRWQCTFCGLFNYKTKCDQCKNMRHNSTYKKCQCKWVNKGRNNRCDKCSMVL